MSFSTTLRAELTSAEDRLRRAGVPDPELDAELLLAHVLGTDRAGILTRARDPLGSELARRYEELVQRRERRQPLQYLTGTQEFYGLEFAVDPRVLIPRPETEGLVEAVLRLKPAEGARVVDLGTGSGCIAVTLAVECPQVRLFAVDRSPAALDVARANALRHGVEQRIEFSTGDLGRVPAVWRGRMDIVASNPPYVTEEEWSTLQPEVRDHEPRDALVSGRSGLEAYRRLAPAAFDMLRPEGRLVVELGYGQVSRVEALLRAAGFTGVESFPDLRGIQRLLVARREAGNVRVGDGVVAPTAEGR